MCGPMTFRARVSSPCLTVCPFKFSHHHTEGPFVDQHRCCRPKCGDLVHPEPDRNRHARWSGRGTRTAADDAFERHRLGATVARRSNAAKVRHQITCKERVVGFTHFLGVMNRVFSLSHQPVSFLLFFVRTFRCWVSFLCFFSS